MSIFKAKYVAINYKIKEKILARRFLNKLFSEQVLKKIKMPNDNKTSFTLIKNPKSQNYTEHINVMYYHIEGLIKQKKLKIKQISNLSILANGLTKTLFVRFFKKHQDK